MTTSPAAASAVVVRWRERCRGRCDENGEEDEAERREIEQLEPEPGTARRLRLLALPRSTHTHTHRDRHTGRDRHTHTDIQTDKHTDNWTAGARHCTTTYNPCTATALHTHRHRDRERHTDRQRDRQIHRDRQTDGQTDNRPAGARDCMTINASGIAMVHTCGETNDMSKWTLFFRYSCSACDVSKN